MTQIPEAKALKLLSVLKPILARLQRIGSGFYADLARDELAATGEEIKMLLQDMTSTIGRGER